MIDRDKHIASLRNALATIYNNTEPDAIRHENYEALARRICECAKGALDGDFLYDDMNVAEVYDKLARQ